MSRSAVTFIGMLAILVSGSLGCSTTRQSPTLFKWPFTAAQKAPNPEPQTVVATSTADNSNAVPQVVAAPSASRIPEVTKAHAGYYKEDTNESLNDTLPAGWASESRSSEVWPRGSSAKSRSSSGCQSGCCAH